MAARSLQRHAGAVWAVIAFLLVCGFYMPVSQAECWITVEGDYHYQQTTLETSRTIQAALEIADLCGEPYISTDDCVESYGLERSPFRTVECSESVCTDGQYWDSTVFCTDRTGCLIMYENSGTWDVVCECLQDSDCDDGVFCNGTESCVDTACVAGTPPCSEGQVCDEDNDQCVECLGNEDCDAGHFCLDGECQFAGSVKDTGDPNERVCNPPSYTDLSNGIVRDNVTGLQWVQDGNLIASRDPSFDTDGTAGDGKVTWQHALDYIALLNADEYLDYSDWRLPTVKELATLVDAGQSSPAIDPVFSNTVAAGYWTSTSFQIWDGQAWKVHFGSREVVSDSLTSRLNVFAVRGGSDAVSDSFVVNGDGTVTDTNTGLVWHQCLNSGIWDQDTAACIANDEPGDYRQPFAYIEALNTASYLGYRDWRLPTTNELLSMIDYSLDMPATTFPMTNPWGLGWDRFFYTSSTLFPSGKRYLSLGAGHVVAFIDAEMPYVRAVRGGECMADSPGCLDNSDCDAGYQCVEGECEPIPDDPPALGAGPYLAAGYWPLLPTSQESPMYLDANYNVLWKFSDDFASCSEACTHVAEYQAVGGSSWSSLDVTVNAAKGTARVTLPVVSLQNATTYAFRYSVTDCASQTTQSAVYYFRVAITDAPPVIKSGPWLAAGSWPLMPTSASSALVLDQNSTVLWTFSDDYAFCSGLCTHRARYKKVDDTAWTLLTVSADPTGKKYAYTELPVVGLAAGTYEFFFDVMDCNGQRTYATTFYYFKVE